MEERGGGRPSRGPAPISSAPSPKKLSIARRKNNGRGPVIAICSAHCCSTRRRPHSEAEEEKALGRRSGRITVRAVATTFPSPAAPPLSREATVAGVWDGDREGEKAAVRTASTFPTSSSSIFVRLSCVRDDAGGDGEGTCCKDVFAAKMVEATAVHKHMPNFCGCFSNASRRV